MQMIKVLKVVSLQTSKLGRVYRQIMAMQRQDRVRQAQKMERHAAQRHKRTTVGHVDPERALQV
jgi:hypothetical protein